MHLVIDEAQEEFRVAEQRIARELRDALGIEPRDLFVCILPQTDGALAGPLAEGDLVNYAEVHFGP